MVRSAKNALKMLLQTMFFIDWQVCCKDEDGQLALHREFATALARRMQRRGVELAGQRFELPEFYLGDLSFVSMNYDPVGLWCQMIANRCMNRATTVPHVGSARKLQVFVDQAHFVAGPRVGRPSEVWHSMNEPAVQRLNEVGECLRVTKFLLPHGCICWRECPNCGKLSNYLGDRWKLKSRTLIPPPPFREFVPDLKPEDARNEEREAWKKGEVDARACVHCGTLTYAHHTSTVMQSNFKARPPSFIEEMQRDLRVVLKKAHHIVLLGYSLPPDDVGYRALLAAHGQGIAGEPVRCTVVGKQKGHERWIGPAELGKNRDLQKDTAVGAAQDLFGRDNVRFYGGGIPEVFSRGGVVTDQAVERLFNWERTHSESARSRMPGPTIPAAAAGWMRTRFTSSAILRTDVRAAARLGVPVVGDATRRQHRPHLPVGELALATGVGSC